MSQSRSMWESLNTITSTKPGQVALGKIGDTAGRHTHELTGFDDVGSQAAAVDTTRVEANCK